MNPRDMGNALEIISSSIVLIFFFIVCPILIIYADRREKAYRKKNGYHGGYSHSSTYSSSAYMPNIGLGSSYTQPQAHKTWAEMSIEQNKIDRARAAGHRMCSACKNRSKCAIAQSLQQPICGGFTPGN